MHCSKLRHLPHHAPIPLTLALAATVKGGWGGLWRPKPRLRSLWLGAFIFIFFPEVPCSVRALVPSQQTAHVPVQVRAEDFGNAPGGGILRACPDLSTPTPMKLGHMALPQGSKAAMDQSPVHSQTQTMHSCPEPLKRHSPRPHGVKCPSLPVP